MTRHLPILLVLATGCGGGVPIELRIDEFTFDLSLDDAVAGMQNELIATGVLPPGTTALPEIWPDSLPDIQYNMRLATEPVPIDLTPEEGSEEANKYEEINKAKEAVRRIEINELVLRVEQSNLSVAIPELTLQAADDPTANPDDRRAWFTIGRLAGADAGAITDIPFEWVMGGETFLNSQLADEGKSLGLRTVGTIAIDTEANPNLPRGQAVMRLIVVATFFVEPEEAL